MGCGADHSDSPGQQQLRRTRHPSPRTPTTPTDAMIIEPACPAEGAVSGAVSRSSASCWCSACNWARRDSSACSGWSFGAQQLLGVKTGRKSLLRPRQGRPLVSPPSDMELAHDTSDISRFIFAAPCVDRICGQRSYGALLGYLLLLWIGNWVGTQISSSEGRRAGNPIAYRTGKQTRVRRCSAGQQADPIDTALLTIDTAPRFQRQLSPVIVCPSTR